MEFENSEFENLESENSEFENLQFENQNLKIQSLKIWNSKIGNLKLWHLKRDWLLFTHWRTMVSRRNEKALRKSNELFLHLIAIEKQHCFVFINYNTLKADMVPMSCSGRPVLLSVYL